MSGFQAFLFACLNFRHRAKSDHRNSGKDGVFSEHRNEREENRVIPERKVTIMKQLKMVQRMYSLLAACLILVGLILLIWPGITINVVCKVVGILLLLCGIVKLIGYFTKDLYQLAFQFDFALGIVSIVLGVTMLTRSSRMIEIGAVCIGIFLLVDAALRIQTAMDSKRFGIDRWWLILLIAIVVGVIGILLLTVPFQTTELITRLIGVNVAFDGILNLWIVRNTVRAIREKVEEEEALTDSSYVEEK